MEEKVTCSYCGKEINKDSEKAVFPHKRKPLSFIILHPLCFFEMCDSSFMTVGKFALKFRLAESIFYALDENGNEVEKDQFPAGIRGLNLMKKKQIEGGQNDI